MAEETAWAIGSSEKRKNRLKTPHKKKTKKKKKGGVCG